MIPTVKRYSFGEFELNHQSGRLLRDGYRVKLQPQPLRVLAILLERRGEVVSRDELRAQIWDEATFVEFDQGLNYCIRQIRLALRDDAANPIYIETVKNQGYRFIAPVIVTEAELLANPADPLDAKPRSDQPELENSGARLAVADARGRSGFVQIAIAAALILIVVAGLWLQARRTHETRATPSEPVALTDFADSAVAPVLSSDGRLLAFIRGGQDFLTPDQVYVKMLPEGEPRRVTNDPRLKYGLAFSPDGSQIAYTVLEKNGWFTYSVPVLGGEPHLLLSNAAGLTWLDSSHFLFSEIKSGQHMGIVSAGPARSSLREIYFPAQERGMAHYSSASPDRTMALIVEMDGRPVWLPCHLVSLTGRFPPRVVGPEGACTAAQWSPDGKWMYFGVSRAGNQQLWRQRFPDGTPEQITSGPIQAQGIAVDPSGRSLITSMGVQENTLWIHESSGDRPLSSEGHVVGYEGSVSYPVFNRDASRLYYLLRRPSEGSGFELYGLTLKTGVGEPLFPGVSIFEYDISPDGAQIVYTTPVGDSTQLWLAPLDYSSPPRKIGETGETSPHFDPRGEILFRATEGRFNYLFRMHTDGSGRSKVVPYPIRNIQNVSPGRNWVTAIAPLLDNSTAAVLAIPTAGGDPIRVCENYCQTAWSTNGKYFFISIEEESLAGAGRSLAIPTRAGEAPPELPASGIRPGTPASAIPGARYVNSAFLIPGPGPDTFLYLKNSVHRNLYRIAVQ